MDELHVGRLEAASELTIALLTATHDVLKRHGQDPENMIIVATAISMFTKEVERVYKGADIRGAIMAAWKDR